MRETSDIPRPKEDGEANARSVLAARMSRDCCRLGGTTTARGEDSSQDAIMLGPMDADRTIERCDERLVVSLKLFLNVIIFESCWIVGHYSAAPL